MMRFTPRLLASMLFAVLAAAPPVAAQDLDPVRVEKRVSRLESELRAVQRKVFPGGDPRYFEPEIAPPPAVVAEPAGTPASAPLVELTDRVGELERQLRTLTGQVEAQGFKLRQIEEAQTRLRGDLEFRLNALEGGAAAGSVPGAAAGAPPADPAMLPPARPGVATRPATVPPTATPPVPAAPATPATAEAAWKIAYARVIAKDWPGAEPALSEFIAAWPKSTRIPQAQYWLGRSHGERGQHAEAAKAYLEVYQKSPRSERAPDALIGLAKALIGLKKQPNACRVLDELDSVYGAKLTPNQQADAKAVRGRAKCTA